MGALRHRFCRAQLHPHLVFAQRAENNIITSISSHFQVKVNLSIMYKGTGNWSSPAV